MTTNLVGLANLRPTIFNVKQSKTHFWKCDFSISNGQFDCT